MAKPTPPDSDSLRGALKRFTEQKDRGTALIGAAWLDDALEQLLRKAFRNKKKPVEELLHPDGPLGTLSARARLAYALGLLEPTAWHDIELIRRIRNQFAHSREDLRFSKPTIRDRCRELHAMKAFQLGSGDPVRGPRQRFVLTIYFLVEYILGMQKFAKPIDDLNGDGYGSWIRRFAKTMTLTRTLEALRALEAK